MYNIWITLNSCGEIETFILNYIYGCSILGAYIKQLEQNLFLVVIFYFIIKDFLIWFHFFWLDPKKLQKKSRQNDASPLSAISQQFQTK